MIGDGIESLNNNLRRHQSWKLALILASLSKVPARLEHQNATQVLLQELTTHLLRVEAVDQ